MAITSTEALKPKAATLDAAPAPKEQDAKPEAKAEALETVDCMGFQYFFHQVRGEDGAVRDHTYGPGEVKVTPDVAEDLRRMVRASIQAERDRLEGTDRSHTAAGQLG
jgi:hypothetical protein